MGTKDNSGKRWKAARRRHLLQNVHNIARKCSTIEKPSSSIVHNNLQANQMAFQEESIATTENPSSLMKLDVNEHQELNQMACYEAERGTEELSFGRRIGNMSFIIEGDNTPEEMNLNTCAVAGAIDAGCGHTQLLEITSTLGLPELSQKLFTFHMDIVNKKRESEALKSMNEAAEEERCAAIEEGKVNAKGIHI